MTRVTCFVFVLALSAPDFLTVAAQDQPATSPKTTSSPAMPVLSGGVATATTGDFNLARQPEGPEHGEEVWIPRSKRWQMHWMPTDLEDYARQLDYFKIELAVAGGGKPELDYVSNVCRPRPDSRQGTGTADGRLCMTWNGKGGKLVEFDKEFLARAEISTTNRMLLQFYPAVVENLLAFKEYENANREGHKHLEEYRMTTFGVRPKGKGYEIYVEKQEFRQPPR